MRTPLAQDRLDLLRVLYGVQGREIARSTGMSEAVISFLLNCRYEATPEQRGAIEQAITGLDLGYPVQPTPRHPGKRRKEDAHEQP